MPQCFPYVQQSNVFLLSIPLIFALCLASPHHHHHHMIIASIPAFLFTFCFLLLHFFLFVLSDVDEIMKIFFFVECLLKEFFLLFFYVKFKGKLENIYGNRWELMDAWCLIFVYKCIICGNFYFCGNNLILWWHFSVVKIRCRFGCYWIGSFYLIWCILLYKFTTLMEISLFGDVLCRKKNILTLIYSKKVENV